VVYNGISEAWMQADFSIVKFTSIFGQGTQLIRGWDAVEAIAKPKPVAKFEPKKETKEGEVMNPPHQEVPIDEDNDQSRQIDHLVLVIHGYYLLTKNWPENRCHC
jgi:hypothetical protein